MARARCETCQIKINFLKRLLGGGSWLRREMLRLGRDPTAALLVGNLTDGEELTLAHAQALTTRSDACRRRAAAAGRKPHRPGSEAAQLMLAVRKVASFPVLASCGLLVVLAHSRFIHSGKLFIF